MYQVMSFGPSFVISSAKIKKMLNIRGNKVLGSDFPMYVSFISLKDPSLWSGIGNPKRLQNHIMHKKNLKNAFPSLDPENVDTYTVDLFSGESEPLGSRTHDQVFSKDMKTICNRNQFVPDTSESLVSTVGSTKMACAAVESKYAMRFGLPNPYESVLIKVQNEYQNLGNALECKGKE
jgi:hypothetical protein